MKFFITIFMVFHISFIMLQMKSTASPLDNYSDKDSYDLTETEDKMSPGRPSVIEENEVALFTDMEDYMDKDVEDEGLLLAFPDIQKRKPSTHKIFRRYCVPRGGNCDHRRKYCCNSSSCRCNLWGANCKCQRMGIFQRWGK